MASNFVKIPAEEREPINSVPVFEDMLNYLDQKLKMDNNFFNFMDPFRQQERKWDDKLFEEQYYSPAAAKVRKEVDMDTSLNLAKLFLCIYLGCDTLPKGCTLADLYFSLLPRMRIRNKTIIDCSQASEDQISAVPLVKEVLSYEFLNSSNASKSYKTPEDRLTFTASNINDWLQKTLALADDPTTEQLFINMVCFIMLSMMTIIKKKEDSVDKHVPLGASSHFQRLFNPSVVGACRFPPPHAKFYKQYFHPNSIDLKYLMALVVQSYIKSNNPQVHDILNAGCLKTLYGHGIGAITWSYKLTDMIKVELNCALKFFMRWKMEDSVKRIKIFQKSPKPESWPWSRLFEQGAYFSLATSENVRFCYVCAYIVTDDPDTVPKMFPFVKHSLPRMFEYASEVAQQILSEFAEEGITVNRHSQRSVYRRPQGDRLLKDDGRGRHPSFYKKRFP